MYKPQYRQPAQDSWSFDYKARDGADEIPFLGVEPCERRVLQLPSRQRPPSKKALDAAWVVAEAGAVITGLHNADYVTHVYTVEEVYVSAMTCMSITHAQKQAIWGYGRSAQWFQQAIMDSYGISAREIMTILRRIASDSPSAMLQMKSTLCMLFACLYASALADRRIVTTCIREGRLYGVCVDGELYTAVEKHSEAMQPLFDLLSIGSSIR